MYIDYDIFINYFTPLKYLLMFLSSVPLSVAAYLSLNFLIICLSNIWIGLNHVVRNHRSI